MIDKNDFARQAELEFHKARTFGESTRKAWENLPGEARTAFAPAMVFLGGLPSETVIAPSGSTSETDRVAAVRLMLLKLGLDSDDPRWSSDVLDHLLTNVVETPGGSVADLFKAIVEVLGDYAPELSKPVANFLKDLIVKCFTRHRSSYDTIDWRQLVESLVDRATRAQLYFALHAIPPQFVSPQLANGIMKGLESTAFQAEAASALAI